MPYPGYEGWFGWCEGLLLSPTGSEHPCLQSPSQAPRGHSACIGDAPGVSVGDAPGLKTAQPVLGERCHAAGSSQGLSCTQQVSVLQRPGGAFGLTPCGVPISWVGVPDEGGKGLMVPGFAPLPSQGAFGSEPGASMHPSRVNPGLGYSNTSS